MHANKDKFAFAKAILAVFCCTLVIAQARQLFGQDAAADPPATPAKAAAKEAAQEAAPKPAEADTGLPPLAKMLAVALENNPDIHVAASQLREAESQLARTRLSVVQQVMELHQSWNTQKQLVDRARANIRSAETQLKSMQALYNTGQPSGTVANLSAAEQHKIEAEVALIQAEAKLAQIQAKLPYVLGTQEVVGPAVGATAPGKPPAGAQGAEETRAAVAVDISPQRAALIELPRESTGLALLQAALDDNTEMDFIDRPIEDVVDYLRDLHNLQIIYDGPAFKKLGENSENPYVAVTANVAGVSLGAGLQLISDLYPEVSFVVRDYGLLVTVKGNEPEGSIPVAEFWKQRRAVAGARRSYTTPGRWSYDAPAPAPAQEKSSPR